MFLCCSTCFGRNIAHHQSSKTIIAASGFTYVFGCRQLRWLSHRSGRQPNTYVKPEAAITVFERLMMGDVSPETCWAMKKHWNNKFYYTVASFWFFLWDLYYDARIHEHPGKIVNNTPSKADNRHIIKSTYHSLNVTNEMPRSNALPTYVLGNICVGQRQRKKLPFFFSADKSTGNIL